MILKCPCRPCHKRKPINKVVIGSLFEKKKKRTPKTTVAEGDGAAPSHIFLRKSKDSHIPDSNRIFFLVKGAKHNIVRATGTVLFARTRIYLKINLFGNFWLLSKGKLVKFRVEANISLETVTISIKLGKFMHKTN